MGTGTSLTPRVNAGLQVADAAFCDPVSREVVFSLEEEVEQLVRVVVAEPNLVHHVGRHHPRMPARQVLAPLRPAAVADCTGTHLDAVEPEVPPTKRVF